MRFLLVICLLLAPLAARAQQLTVFAAASLTDAMKDVSAQWQKAGHQPLRMSFASSSTLARQIEQGAPVNVFASADEKWMNYLAKKDLIAADSRKDLLGNDLVLVVPANKPQHVTIGHGFNLVGLLGPSGRVATGDPAHVPVGIYAEQALKNLGIWDAVMPHIARTDDVRSALLLVERGEAPAGIVYATDAAVSKAVMVAGTFPASSHDPVTYPFAVTKSGDTPDARALMTFLSGPQARAIFVKRGFKVE
ncbi:MAG TPA: molybdate ABC transporter substrate-binding protein [Acetobacteraceae bacterium]|nr:molybdate ABC transporter substrate-binding protein [Acetobacteraceae bacterium]